MAKTLTEKMCENNWMYSVVRFLWTAPNHTRYYRHIRVIGKENIPEKGPLIFAPNHQNALMDAMAVLLAQKHQVVFVARADIFKKKSIAKILNFLKILPIYRKRDGGNSLENNQETFAIIDQVLKSGKVHGIFPEGVYNPYKRLGPLQKGIFRTALKAQEAFGNQDGVKIIPVGLNWQNPKKFFQNLTIVYGKPINVSDYFVRYQENPAKAYLEIRDVLSEKMSEVMIDIRSETHYDIIENIRESMGYEFAKKQGINLNHPLGRLHAEQKLVKIMDRMSQQKNEKIERLENLFSKYQNGLQKLKLLPKTLRKSKNMKYELIEDFAVLLFGLPIALIGALLGCLPLNLQKKYEGIIEDPQFLSSVRYVVAMLVRIVQNLILGLGALFLCKNILQMLVVLFLLRYAERLMLFYVGHYKQTQSKLRFVRLNQKNNTELNEIKNIQNEILSVLTTEENNL